MPPSPPPASRPWTPPAAPTRGGAEHLPGTLGGSRLFDQPRHRADAEVVRTFLAEPGPVSLEIGVDHAMRILSAARRWPERRWLGVEIRAARVAAAAPHAPPNCLLWRGDARALLATLVPPGRLDHVDVLFPDPVWHEPHRARHLLFSPPFVALLTRALRPGEGTLHVATDVPGYFAYVQGLLTGWSPAPDPPAPPELSRRERVCRRDGLPVGRGTWRVPAQGAPEAAAR